jgi:hypothetical protein
MYKFVNIGERKFSVVRISREEFTTDDVKDSIKQRNPLIDVVISDGRGHLLFCHEMKDAQFRDVEPQDDTSNAGE